MAPLQARTDASGQKYVSLNLYVGGSGNTAATRKAHHIFRINAPHFDVTTSLPPPVLLNRELPIEYVIRRQDEAERKAHEERVAYIEQKKQEEEAQLAQVAPHGGARDGRRTNKRKTQLKERHGANVGGPGDYIELDIADGVSVDRATVGQEKYLQAVAEAGVTADARRRARLDETRPWILESETGGRRYRAQAEGMHRQDDFLLVVEGNRARLVPIANWYTFTPELVIDPAAAIEFENQHRAAALEKRKNEAKNESASVFARLAQKTQATENNDAIFQVKPYSVDNMELHSSEVFGLEEDVDCDEDRFDDDDDEMAPEDDDAAKWEEKQQKKNNVKRRQRLNQEGQDMDALVKKEMKLSNYTEVKESTPEKADEVPEKDSKGKEPMGEASKRKPAEVANVSPNKKPRKGSEELVEDPELLTMNELQVLAQPPATVEEYMDRVKAHPKYLRSPQKNNAWIKRVLKRRMKVTEGKFSFK